MTRSRKMLWALAILVVGYIGYTSLPDAGAMLSGAREKDAARLTTLEQIALADEAMLSDEIFTKDLEAARAAVPVEPDLPAVIDTLDDTVRLTGMRWTSGAPSPQDAGLLDGSSGQWQISMTVSGQVQQVPTLLAALRELPRLVTVDSVQVRSEGTGVTVQLTLRFFALPGDPLAFDAPAEGSVEVLEGDPTAPAADPSEEG